MSAATGELYKHPIDNYPQVTLWSFSEDVAARDYRAFDFNDATATIDPSRAMLSQEMLADTVLATVGLTNEAIAKLTNRGKDTVKESLSRVYEKLWDAPNFGRPRVPRSKLVSYLFANDVFTIERSHQSLYLNGQERLLIALAADGLCSQEIGNRLGKNDMYIRRKLGRIGTENGLHGRDQLITAALLSGEIVMQRTLATSLAS